MRKNIVAGNWKMNTTLEEGVELANEINSQLKELKLACDVIICVPFTHLTSVNAMLDPELVSLGAENCSEHSKGAYTGEVSASMIKSTGANYVIIGHSERRQYFGETNNQLLVKTRLALENSLTPIFCVGEVLEDRENGNYYDVVQSQIEALFTLLPEEFGKIIIAYEPVWAIGTGRTATAAQAQDMHSFIRKVVTDKYGNDIASDISILYGGSCKPENAREIFSKPDVDGGLIGGAALKTDSFIKIIEAFNA